MIPILVLVFLCLQVTVVRTPTREYSINLPTALSLKARIWNLKRILKRNKGMPFKLNWSQKVERHGDGSFKIWTPWYFRKRNVIAMGIGGSILLSLLFQFPIPIVFGIAKTWNGTTPNWEDAASWNPPNAPAIGDDVTFDGTSVANCNINVPTNDLNSLTIANAYNGTIGFNGNLFVGGNVTIGNAVSFSGADGIIIDNQCNLSVASTITCDLTLSPGVGNSVVALTNCTVSGDYSVTNGTHNLNSLQLNANGACSVAGLLTPGVGGVIIFGSSASLVITGKIGADLAYTLTIGCSLSDSSGEISAPNAGGTFGFSGSSWGNLTTFTPNTCTMIWSGTVAQTNTTAFSVPFLRVTNTTANVSLYTITVNGVSGANWNQQQLQIATGGKCEGDGCIYTTIGMQATSGYFMSKNHGGAANTVKVYGIQNSNSPSVSYRISSLDLVTTLNATVYSTSFDTALTVNSATGCTSLTVGASTTTTNNNTLTVSGALANAGTFVNGNGSTLAGTSAVTSTTTSAGTWTWGNCTVSLRDIQWDVTTGGSSVAIVFGDDMTLDGWITSIGDSTALGTGSVNVNTSKTIQALGTITCGAGLILTGGPASVGASGSFGSAVNWTHTVTILTTISGGVYIGARTLNISGNLANAGTFTNNTTTITFNGTTAQTNTAAFTVTNLTTTNSVGSVTLTSVTVSGIVTATNVKLELISSTFVATTCDCGTTGRIYCKDVQGVNGNFAIILANGGSQAYSDIAAGTRADANDDVYIYVESGGTGCTFSFDVAALNFGVLYKQAGKTINITWGTYTAPGVPTGAAISTAVNAQLTFSWVTPVSTGGWKIQGYDIWRSQTSGTETLHSEDGIVNTHVDTGLTARDVYYYQALSWNSVGDSSLTTEVTAMVNGPPNVPQSLAISLEFDRSLCITWATPADNGNFAISAYKVYSDIFTPPTTLEATLGVILHYQDIPITNRVLRYYKVTAVNSYGEGAASSIVSDTPECHSGLGFCSGNLTQTITIKPRSGTNKNGQPAFGNSFTAYGRITYSNRNARDNKGEVVLSKVQILVDGSVDVDSYDSITLSDGRTMPIIEVREIYQVISGTAITVQKEIYT